MNFKIPLFLLAIGLLIAFSPEIYAGAIEPHITIFMDPGQTTDPFQIKDDSNNDVFSIDATGHPTIEHDMRQFTYSSEVGEEITGVDWVVGDITTSTHAGVLAYWELTYENQAVLDSFPVFAVPAQGISMEAHHTGVGTACYFARQYESNGGFWTMFDSSPASVNSASYATDANWDAEDGIYDVEALRVVVYTSGTDTCTFKNLDSSALLHIPKWITVTKIK